MIMYCKNCGKLFEQGSICPYCGTNHQSEAPAPGRNVKTVENFNLITALRDKLAYMDDGKFSLISAVELKDPTTILLISIFLGGLGIDRFMIGDIGMGILKLLTGGLCGVLTIIDWFTISKKVKELNFNNVMALI